MYKKISGLFMPALFLSIIIYAGSFRAGDISKVENFSLKDYNGQNHSLTDYKNSKAIVLIFMSTQCPVSRAYNARMEQLNNDFKDRNVTFLGINANSGEDVDEIKQYAKDNNLTFPILKDVNNKIADRLQAVVTPEAYVLNGSFDLLYHGRIDDSRRGDEIKNQDLRTAIGDVLNGKPVSVKETKAFGCSIKRVKGANE